MRNPAATSDLPTRMEWPTFGLILMTYGLWAWSVTAGVALSLPLAILVLTFALVLHASLTHEVIHGHPTPWAWVNGALMRPALGLVIPFGRFRDQHLAHHLDEHLTDPYDDPETNFLDPSVWGRLPPGLRKILEFNNTLAGRLLLGPLLSSIVFVLEDVKAIWFGETRVRNSWLSHILCLVPVLSGLVFLSGMPIWAYLVACYSAMSVLRVRTFLEHRAHTHARARTVVIEDRGLFAFLFLNNNFHVVHHMHPKLAWYLLPGKYFDNRAHYLRRNGGYRYRSYGEVFRSYFLRAKDPVPHPLWPQSEASAPLSSNPLRPLDAVANPLPIAPQPVVKPDN